MATLTIKRKDGTEDEVEASGVQTPPARLGQHSLNGIQMIATLVDVNQNINPADGKPYAQVMSRPLGGMISPPPSRRFDGR